MTSRLGVKGDWRRDRNASGGAPALAERRRSRSWGRPNSNWADCMRLHWGLSQSLSLLQPGPVRSHFALSVTAHAPSSKRSSFHGMLLFSDMKYWARTQMPLTSQPPAANAPKKGHITLGVTPAPRLTSIGPGQMPRRPTKTIRAAKLAAGRRKYDGVVETTHPSLRRRGRCLRSSGGRRRA